MCVVSDARGGRAWRPYSLYALRERWRDRHEGARADIPGPPRRIPWVRRPPRRPPTGHLVEPENRAVTAGAEREDVVAGAHLTRRSGEPEVVLVERRPVVADRCVTDADAGGEDPIVGVANDRHAERRCHSRPSRATQAGGRASRRACSRAMVKWNVIRSAAADQGYFDVAMMWAMPEERDTIPRLHRVLDHARDQLVNLDGGADTFEDCRLRYHATQERLVREGRGRVTASRVADSERNWAPTRDCLQELMRWGAVEQRPVPSERKFVSTYRDSPYPLTDRGRELAAAARESRAVFTDEVSEAIIRAHPYVRRLLTVLASGVISYPLVAESDVQVGRRDGRTLVDWAAWATERTAGEPSVEMLERELRRHLARFRRRGPEKPSNKELADAMNDAFAVAAFAARGTPIDGPTIKALLRWGSELLLYDQSRQVPSYPQATVIWGCSDITHGGDGSLIATRRGRIQWGEQVAQALVDVYREQADADDSRMAAPFLAVHRVRAQVAAQVGVTRALVDRVLADLVDGDFPDLPFNAAVFVGSTTQLPTSEPPFRYRGGRRLVLQVTPTTRPGREEE